MIHEEGGARICGKDQKLVVRVIIRHDGRERSQRCGSTTNTVDQHVPDVVATRTNVKFINVTYSSNSSRR